MNSRKGQIWSTDFIMGTLILAFILLLFVLLWNGLTIRSTSISDYWQMQANALFATEALMATSGDPESWELMDNINDSDAIGIVNGRNEINDMKMARLVEENSSSYEYIKERLGVQKYQLGIKVTDLSRETVFYEFGKFPGGMDNVVAFDRYGILNQSIAIVRVEVWK